MSDNDQGTHDIHDLAGMWERVCHANDQQSSVEERDGIILLFTNCGDSVWDLVHQGSLERMLGYVEGRIDGENL